VVDVGDQMVGQASLVEPMGEGEQAALGSAKLFDLGDEEGAGGAGGVVGVKNSGKEMAAASAPWISVSPVARRAAMEKAMAMRWSVPESMVAPWRVGCRGCRGRRVLGELALPWRGGSWRRGRCGRTP
jgi:hypothetical protein